MSSFKAFKCLKSPAQLVIAGNDMGALDSISIAAQKPRCAFCGNTGRARPPCIVARHSGFGLRIRNEIFGLVPFEGLLCGAPTVVSDDCGCGEIIQTAQAGLLVKYGDAAGLAER